ncbi:nuclear transport factor 2 family protein [Bradyrhizobium sp. 1]|uniref:nuclear transport factor 2 family protein n=1 Tax=Bradyrhizobium sp. 1 TaxID=241591 RepID=UPI001FF9D22F|nr:nuclear transport factor 2 family protein [Bradyrhizobium sp. 1]MCK1395744.1 nuclear transport factor 2 family protein [Bradyrhizobium sp. 1]
MTQAMKKAAPVFEVVPYGHPDFFKRYGDAWGNKETLISYYAENGQYTDKASSVVVKGREMISRFMNVYLRFSPLCTVTFTNVTAAENGFAAEWVWEGTNDGPLRLHGFNCPQDGSAWCIDGVSVCTVNSKGQIQTHADYWDSEALLRTWKVF